MKFVFFTTEFCRKCVIENAGKGILCRCENFKMFPGPQTPPLLNIGKVIDSLNCGEQTFGQNSLCPPPQIFLACMPMIKITVAHAHKIFE